MIVLLHDVAALIAKATTTTVAAGSVAAGSVSTAVVAAATASVFVMVVRIHLFL